MQDKIEVSGAQVVHSTAKPPVYNPLNRPEISYKKPIIFLCVYVLGLVLLLCFYSDNFYIKKWIVILAFTLIYIFAILKKAIIWLVHLYQNKASDKTRLRCVFEPSCSEYMIMSVEKYGALIGLFKGIIRLLRCHPPNGGPDYP